MCHGDSKCDAYYSAASCLEATRMTVLPGSWALSFNKGLSSLLNRVVGSSRNDNGTDNHNATKQ